MRLLVLLAMSLKSPAISQGREREEEKEERVSHRCSLLFKFGLAYMAVNIQLEEGLERQT